MTLRRTCLLYTSITLGGFKLAVSASREFSALLGIPRSLVYSIAPISGIFIIIAQIINIYQDITGEKVDATLPILCIYPFVQKFFTQGVMVGSVKG